MDHAKRLKIMARAWGRQRGYVFLPWIDREQQAKSTDRRAGYNEGQAFHWPSEREAILEHMAKHEHHDLYWCPVPFEYPNRRQDLAMDERGLWADLDEVDPRTLEEYPPTVAWETSPGRFQALWLLSSGDLQGASWPGNENQRMTYLVGADLGGWDTTQLLRVPEWPNHKPAYVKANGGKPVPGKLLWGDGTQYLSEDFKDLPEISSAQALTSIAEDEVDGVDREKVIARIRLKIPKAAREKLTARVASGDRSEALWSLERDLADAGCTAAEIVSVIRGTVWNKYHGRADELHRLVTEAGKAIAARPEDVQERIQEERDQRPKPQRLGLLLKNIPTPEWLIRDIWTRGACGFIAGQPKAMKSWVALDMALSVASGADFLGQFRVEHQGPVLYIQEEDPAPLLRSRVNKIWPGKLQDKLVLEAGEVFWLPQQDKTTMFYEADLPVDAMIQSGLTVSDEAWQVWLDETLSEGQYVLLLIDTLMMTAGDVEENRSQEMTSKIFKPLKALAHKYGCSLGVVHHMRKGQANGAPQRAGQMLLGSVANHAWAEDSLYLARSGRDIKVETESKTVPGTTFKLTNIDNRLWEPRITLPPRDDQRESGVEVRAASKPSSKGNPPSQGANGKRSAGRPSRIGATIDALRTGPKTKWELHEITGLSMIQLQRQLTKLKTQHDVTWRGQYWEWTGGSK
jgi:hypothetical protein